MAAEGEKTLEAQIKLAGPQYEARREYDPKFAALNLKVLNQSLFGADGDPGLLDTYSKAAPYLSRFTADAQASQRESDIADVERLGPRAAEALRATDPRAKAIEDKLASQAMDELNSGASLDPALADQVSQGVRAAQAARGMGFGLSDVATESLFLGREAEAMRRARQNFASNVSGRLRAVTGDPFMAILGRSAAVPAMTAAAASEGRTLNAGGPVFDPWSAYGADVANTNFNAAASGAITNANNKAALTGAAIQAGGSLLGSL